LGEALQCCLKCLQHDKRCPLCRAPANKSYAELLRRLQKHVDKGNAEAQVQLGDAYCEEKYGLKKSPKRAFQLYKRAAAQGHPRGQVKLGECYHRGDSVKINYKTAALWYRRAAEQGYPIAQYILGVVFYHGKGVVQSHDEAARWFRLAAAQGYSDALYELGCCHADGEGGGSSRGAPPLQARGSQGAR
jgi:hypothetical protein